MPPEVASWARQERDRNPNDWHNIVIFDICINFSNTLRASASSTAYLWTRLQLLHLDMWVAILDTPDQKFIPDAQEWRKEHFRCNKPITALEKKNVKKNKYPCVMHLLRPIEHVLNITKCFTQVKSDEKCDSVRKSAPQHPPSPQIHWKH